MLSVSPGFLMALPKQSSVLVSRMSPGFNRATACATPYTYFTFLIVARYFTTLPGEAWAEALAALTISNIKIRTYAFTTTPRMSQEFHCISALLTRLWSITTTHSQHSLRSQLWKWLSVNPRQPRPSYKKSRQRDGQTHPKIIPETDFHLWLGGLDHDEIGHAPGDRKVARKSGSHG